MKKRDRDTRVVTRSKTNFKLPLKKDRQGNFKIKEKAEVATCLHLTFLLKKRMIGEKKLGR